MKELRFAFILLLLCAFSLSAQPVPIAGPFKISRDDTTASFFQDKPFTTTYDSLSFFVSWRDNRIYPDNLFGVRVNKQGLPETKSLTFKKRWNDEYITAFGTRFLSLSSSSWTRGPDIEYTFKGDLLFVNGSVTNNLPITVVTVGDFGPQDVFFSSFVKNERLYLFASVQNQTNLTILDSTGITVKIKSARHAPIYGLNSAGNITGEFLTAYYNLDLNKITVNCYNSADSIIVQAKPILDLPPSTTYHYISPIKILPTKDNNFLIVFSCSDTLYTSLVSPLGNLLRPVDKFYIRAASGENYFRPLNFIFTTINNGIADLFVTVQSNASPVVYRTKVFSFSEYGLLTDTAGTYSFNEKLNGGLFKTGTLQYLTADTSQGDIYLKEINNFNSTLVRKLNDDRRGTNEVEGQVVSDNAGHPFAVWHNGTQRLIQPFNVNGTTGNTATVAPAYNHFGHPDGTLRFLESGTSGTVLIRKYSTDLSPLGTDTLRTVEGVLRNAVKFTGRALPNNNIMYVAAANQFTYVVLTSSSGVVLASDTIQSATSSNGMHPAIYIIDNDSVYVTSGSLARKYRYTLQRTGEAGSINSSYYVAGNIFGLAYSQSIQIPVPHSVFVLSMWRTNGTLVVNSKSLGRVPDYAYQSQVAYNRFGIFAKTQEGFLQFRVFDTTGADVITPLTIEPAGLFYGGLSFSVADNNIYFVWSDNRNGNADVFCKVYALAPLLDERGDGYPTRVEKFELSQNYPNPFTPATVINYSVPVKSAVTLKVYDILGKEIRTLVNSFREAGHYSVEFNGSDLPSGVYLYKLTAGNYTKIMKMLLLK